MEAPPDKGDKEHWLRRFTPREWLGAAMAEMRRAEEAYARRSTRAGLAGARRAAGMALNAALLVEPDEAWGRTYVEHLLALRKDARVPPAVQRAAEILTEMTPGGAGQFVSLRTKDMDTRVLEAARDVMAHAYAVLARHEARGETG